MRARVPESPFQTVRVDFPHTAYRWSSHEACASKRTLRANRSLRAVTPQSVQRATQQSAAQVTLGTHAQPVLEFSCFFRGVVGPFGHALTLTSGRRRDQSRAPFLGWRSGHHLLRYYEPLGLPSGTVPLRSRLIGPAFARRGPPVRVSPVPHQTLAACPLPYPGSVLRASSLARAVCCLRRDMIGSATPPFGSYLTRLQRFTHSLGPLLCSRSAGPTPRLRLSTLRSNG